MIRAVVFDLNGVFLKSRFLTDRLKEDFEIPIDESIKVLKECMSIVRLDSKVKVYTFWKPLLDKYRVEMDEEKFLKYWFSGESIVYELIDLCKELREKGFKVYILSNNFEERTQYYRDKFPEIFKNVDNAFFSWETGNIKSNIDTYRELLDWMKVKGKEVLYFDDSEDNITLAKKVGIKGYVFEDKERMEEIIERVA